MTSKFCFIKQKDCDFSFSCACEVSDVYALGYWVEDYNSWITFRAVMLQMYNCNKLEANEADLHIKYSLNEKTD